MTRLCLTFCLFALFLIAAAQETKPRIFKAVRSPEIASDGRVTFKFYAPNALKAQTFLDGRPLTMQKDEKGVWSVTTTALAPDIYSYYFLIDGVQLSDHANTLLKPIVTGGAESLLHVPGPKTLSWEENDVPHGTLHRHRFRSSVIGEFREFLVYTPPGYSERRSYPTLYLLHGVMEDEAAWTGTGKAHIILDNLVAQQRAKPMVLVMPLGYGFANVPDRVGGVLTGQTNHQQDFDRLFQMLSAEIQPLVEKGYRVGKRREDRALAGLSMGGAQALYIGLNRPDRFGSVASFSGAFLMYGTSLDSWLKIDPKAKLPRLTLTCGTEDFLLGSNRQQRQWLKDKGIDVKATETSGGHTWSVWRRNLESYLPTLFR